MLYSTHALHTCEVRNSTVEQSLCCFPSSVSALIAADYLEDGTTHLDTGLVARAVQKKPVLAGSCTMHITPANIFAKFGSFASTFASTWQEGAHTWIAGKSTHLDRREATKTYLCKQVLNVPTLIPISMLIDQLQQRDRPP